ncbi:DUF6069 family protein [Streptomyces sp. AS02]|uniref:DUF6069 family protein n=1 Tax=Streptomyces sp. AS02 TaxID=2938946 RepID=UPI00201FCE75|nr:DUF6069 family protein [Streptomyces sp. AS02]MCL8011384.1 DUF6069 family protein [Streptomyces sp. AS02]
MAGRGLTAGHGADVERLLAVGARRARAVWTAVAGAVLAVFFLPFIGDGMDGGTRVSHAVMHLAVAAMLIPGLGGRSPGAGAGTAKG